LCLVILTVVYLDFIGIRVLYLWLLYLNLRVVLGNFDCSIFELERDPCFVLCIIFGPWESCFVLLTVLYLDTKRSRVSYF